MSASVTEALLQLRAKAQLAAGSQRELKATALAQLQAQQPGQTPSGPRKKHEGVEDEDQGIVQAEPTPTGGAQLRLTLLCAGYIIGPSGASVREISRLTGADVRSWSETWNQTQAASGSGSSSPAAPPPPPRARKVRTLVVGGRRRAVVHALEIITAAVDRYCELTDGTYSGRAVERAQVIAGVTFFYSPPPRAVVPFAAALRGHDRAASPSARKSLGFAVTAATAAAAAAAATSPRRNNKENAAGGSALTIAADMEGVEMAQQQQAQQVQLLQAQLQHMLPPQQQQQGHRLSPLPATPAPSPTAHGGLQAGGSTAQHALGGLGTSLPRLPALAQLRRLQYEPGDGSPSTDKAPAVTPGYTTTAAGGGAASGSAAQHYSLFGGGSSGGLAEGGPLFAPAATSAADCAVSRSLFASAFEAATPSLASAAPPLLRTQSSTEDVMMLAAAGLGGGGGAGVCGVGGGGGGAGGSAGGMAGFSPYAAPFAPQLQQQQQQLLPWQASGDPGAQVMDMDWWQAPAWQAGPLPPPRW